MHVKDLSTRDPGKENLKHFRSREVELRKVGTRTRVGLEGNIDTKTSGFQGPSKASAAREDLNAKPRPLRMGEHPG